MSLKLGFPPVLTASRSEPVAFLCRQQSAEVTPHDTPCLAGMPISKGVNWEMLPISHSLKLDCDVRDIFSLFFFLSSEASFPLSNKILCELL